MARLQTLLALRDPFAGRTTPAPALVDPHPADETPFTTAVTYARSRWKRAEARAWWYDEAMLSGWEIRESGFSFATVSYFLDTLDSRQIGVRVMAELSRVRGADTEEQLLELQRAFLASEESRASPAARVQRVGGAPPRPPTADEAAGIVSALPTEIDTGAATAGPRDPGPGDHETAPPLPTELRDVVTEVVERRVGETAPKPPELRGPGVSFPRATHRAEGPFAARKSKFMADREARRARAAAGDPGVRNPEVAPPGTVRVGNADVSFQMMPPRGAKPPRADPDDDAAGPARRGRAVGPAPSRTPPPGSIPRPREGWGRCLWRRSRRLVRPSARA